MLGAVVGDIVGSRFEWNNTNSKDFALFTSDCFPTDDSIMTLAVAKALMSTLETNPEGDIDDQLSKATIKYLREIGQQYPDCGYGARFNSWMFDANPRPYFSFGNGAAMRISPVGFLATNLEQAKKWSAAVTRVTHNHPEGIKGAEVTTLVIFLARQGVSKAGIRRAAEEYYPLNFTIAEISPGFAFDESCQKTVPPAIECFLESDSFEDAIRIAISLGGDSDTIAAITGSMADAFYGGVPEAIANEAKSFLDATQSEIVQEWENFTQGR